MKTLDRIKALEDELALLKADLTLKEEPIICGHPEISFEVHPKELGNMNWEDAKEACADLGIGWRLPTRLELLLMYNNQDELGGFANNNYWSSTEYANTNAWNQNFTNGYQNANYKNLNYYVRAVRALTLTI